MKPLLVQAWSVARFVFAIVVLAVALHAQGATNAPQHACAATVNPLATDAALAAMRAGGNAVDGAIAAALTLAVVDIHNSGLGGGLFMLVRKPDGTFVAIDGRETAPAGATPSLYRRDGKPDPKLIQHGALAAAVPGEVAALNEASRRFGRVPLPDHFRRAATLAENGFAPDRVLLSRRDDYAGRLKAYPDTAAVLLQPLKDGKFIQPELAASLRALADNGADWFYRGAYAAKVEQWMKSHRGVMTARDFAEYSLKERTALRTTYRGFEIVGFPPPSSGGVHVAEILNILENFDLAKMGDSSPEFYHVVAEAMKLAFADRAHWLGDPKFTPVPKGLTDKQYAKQLAARISLDRATEVKGHGEPPNAGGDVFDRHTTHFSVADADGWWVGCTATINYTFGSLVMVPGTGILLNDEMDDFALPGVANSFGLIGSEANAVAPGKRPLSSMSPTIVLRDGKPVLVIGAAGGPTIISQVVLGIVRAIDFKLPVGETLGRPRVHQQWSPDTLRIESAVPEGVRTALQMRGHKLEVVKTMGVCQAIALDAGGGFAGAHDPRVPGKAAAF